MKTLINYNEFLNENKLNENFVTKNIKKLVSFFIEKFKKHAWEFYMKYLAKNNLLKGNIEFYSPDMDIDIDIEDDEAVVKEKISVTFGNNINEKAVSLKSDKYINITAKELKSIIERAYYMNLDRAEEGEERSMTNALFIWGAPGIGKTSILKQVCKKLDIKLVSFHLASTEPTDFRGVPKIENIVKGSTDTADERTVNKLPAVFPTSNCKNGKGGILFFDELNQAKQAILSAALPLILEGELGDYKIPDKWLIIAAGNRQEDLAGGGTEMEAPMANRFSHYNYAPDLEEDFIPYCVNHDFMNPDIIGFLLFKNNYFHNLDPEKELNTWASPRSWEMASKVDYFERNYDWKNKIPKQDLIDDIYAPHVGRETAVSFAEYIDLKEFFNETDVKNVFTIGTKAKRLPNRPDHAYAATGSISLYKKGQKLSEDELRNCLEWSAQYLEKGEKLGFETITPLIALLNWIHPECKTDPKLNKIYMDFIKKWHLSISNL